MSEVVRELRRERGWTQPALAERARIEQSYLSKLENGRAKPSREVCERLATALDVPLDRLLGRDVPGAVRAVQAPAPGPGAAPAVAAGRRVRARVWWWASAACLVLVGLVVALGLTRGSPQALTAAPVAIPAPPAATPTASVETTALVVALHAAAPPGVRVSSVAAIAEGGLLVRGTASSQQAFETYLVALGELAPVVAYELADESLFSLNGRTYHVTLRPHGADVATVLQTARAP